MSYSIAELENPYTDAINNFLGRLSDSFDAANRERIETKELVLNHVDQKYLHFFLGFLDLKEDKKKDEFKANLFQQKSEPLPKTDKLSKLDHMIQQSNSPVVRKAIPFSIQKLEKIVLERCFLKTQNF
jgi:hypothetical protein